MFSPWLVRSEEPTPRGGEEDKPVSLGQLPAGILGLYLAHRHLGLNSRQSNSPAILLVGLAICSSVKVVLRSSIG